MSDLHDSMKKMTIQRREFLKHGALAGAAALVADSASADTNSSDKAGAVSTSNPAPLTMEKEMAPPADVQVMSDHERAGSDFMVDVLKSLDFDYVLSNPGSSFRGLHESLINYGENNKPEFVTCLHEESSVAMAHGYFKATGKMLPVLSHGTVGLQHASMAIYNAWCDRVPVYVILGNHGDAALRRQSEWYHGVQDAAHMVRDYTKWDDMPMSLGHFAESSVRAYKVAMTPPMAPVVITAEGHLQEDPIPLDAGLAIPRLTIPSPPQGDDRAVEMVASYLADANSPVLVVDRLARTQAGVDLLVEIAEMLGAAVVDKGSRMNMPSRHPLNQTQRANRVVADADVIVGLELPDFWYTINSHRDQLHRSSRRVAKADAKLVSITAEDLYIQSNYQDFRRMQEVDVAIAADGEATLPKLIESVRRKMSRSQSRAAAARTQRYAESRRNTFDATRRAASYAWDSSPVSTARLCGELWAQIRNEDWSLVSSYYSDGGGWPRKLWNFDKHYQWLGHAGGGGIGYGAPASVGAALGNRDLGRLSVSIQTDGDMMYAPGVFWTAARYKIPLLCVMNNNRAYHMELMHIQRMCNARNRGIDRARIGNEISDPNIDFARMVSGMGVYTEGPISDPAELGAAIGRALEVVKSGEPALVDVVTQVR